MGPDQTSSPTQSEVSLDGAGPVQTSGSLVWTDDRQYKEIKYVFMAYLTIYLPQKPSKTRYICL